MKSRYGATKETFTCARREGVKLSLMHGLPSREWKKMAHKNNNLESFDSHALRENLIISCLNNFRLFMHALPKCEDAK